MAIPHLDAWIILGYVALPLLIFAIYWLVSKLRRTGGPGDEGGETGS